MSVLKKIFLHLKEQGFDVYFPAQHVGECKSTYLVVKDSGANEILGTSSNKQFFDILIYVPEDCYCDIDEIKLEVKSKMKGLIELKESGQETASFYEEEMKAHMVSIMYENVRRK